MKKCPEGDRRSPTCGRGHCQSADLTDLPDMVWGVGWRSLAQGTNHREQPINDEAALVATRPRGIDAAAAPVVLPLGARHLLVRRRHVRRVERLCVWGAGCQALGETGGMDSTYARHQGAHAHTTGMRVAPTRISTFPRMRGKRALRRSIRRTSTCAICGCTGYLIPYHPE